jgi:hypothetical protein
VEDGSDEEGNGAGYGYGHGDGWCGSVLTLGGIQG